MKVKNKKEKGGNVNLAENMYEASVTFGRIVAYFQLFGGITIGIICLLIGIYLLRKKPLEGKGVAKVTAISCDSTNIQNNKPCTATVQYVAADGKQYSAIINGTYIIGQEIVINYDPKYPQNASQSLSTKNIGIGLIVVGTLITLGAILWFYLVQKYKIAAAAAGVGEAANIITNTI